jgi:ankyrin repeat protein
VNKATPLHHACGRGDELIAKLLLERGADVNALDEHGMSALHVATLNGKGDVAKLLLSHGASTRQRDVSLRAGCPAPPIVRPPVSPPPPTSSRARRRQR